MTQSALDRALELCAVTGRFSPTALVSVLGDDLTAQGETDALWRGLSTQVTEVLAPSFGWSLRPDTRRAVLASLTSQKQIRAVLQRARGLPPQEPFGEFLRQFLQGRHVKVETSHLPDSSEGLAQQLTRAGAMLDAVQFAQAVPALDASHLKQTLNAVKRYIIELQRRRDMAVVLPEEHIGYGAQRTRISAFLRGVTTDEDTRPMFVSGLGGVGKSALLARIFKYWQRRKGAPLTVILDFDRRQLNAGAPEELFKEFLRQTAAGIQDKGFDAAQAQAISDGLQAMRNDVYVGSDSFGGERSYQAQIDAIEARLPEMMAQPWTEQLLAHPIAVLFDTFEALEWADTHGVRSVLRFEDLLRRFFPHLRSLFVGREDPLDDAGMTALFGAEPRRIRLQGLNVADAVKLLDHEDTRLAGSEADRRLADTAFNKKIAKITRGHPLALLMLAKHVHSDADALQELKDEIEKGRWVGAQFAQKFTYERTLSRITNREVRQLAHPGLVLHQINADLIRFVLAGPCFGEATDISPEKAERLLAELAKEYWLVKDGTRGFDLRHRPDLRLLMVPGLFAEPLQSDRPEEQARKRALTEKARQVCRNAHDYFRAGPPAPSLNAQARWQEIPSARREAYALYYLALISQDDPPSFSETVAQEMHREFQDEWDLLPRSWRVQVNALREEFVAEDDLDLLSGALFEKAQKQAFSQESQVGRSSRGFGLSEQTPHPSRREDAQQGASTTRTARNISRAFGTANFDELQTQPIAEYLQTVLEADFQSQVMDLARQGLWSLPIWQATLWHATNRPETITPHAALSIVQALVDPSQDRKDRLEWLIEGTGVTFSEALEIPDWFGHVLDRYRYDVGPRWRDPDSKFRQLVFDPSVLCLGVSGRPEEMFQSLKRYMPDVARIAAQLHQDPSPSLSTFEKLYANARNFTVTLSRGTLLRPEISSFFAKMLRGLTPDIHEPLASVLSTIDDAQIRTAVSELEPHARFLPHEFVSQTTQKGQRHIISLALVEAVDRVGHLRPFMQSLKSADPRMERLVKMYDFITYAFFEPTAPYLQNYDL